jgi:hypothetical protein
MGEIHSFYVFLLLSFRETATYRINKSEVEGSKRWYQIKRVQILEVKCKYQKWSEVYWTEVKWTAHS